MPKGYRLRLPVEATEWTTETLAQQLGPREQYAGQPRARSYRVRQGDTLAKVARSQGVPVAELARLNRLSQNDALRAGRTLRLPEQPPALVAAVESAIAAGEPAAAPPAPALEEPRFYVVRAGDSLAAIAGRVNLTQSQLVALNGIRNPDSIYEGQRLRLVPDPAPVPQAGSAPEVDAAPPPSASPSRAALRLPRARRSRFRAARRAMRDLAGAGWRGAAGRAIPPSTASMPTARSGSRRPRHSATTATGLAFPLAACARLNGLRAGSSVAMGREVRLDFSRVSQQQFEQRRRAYHHALQTEFFSGHRIVGTEVYVTRRGDSLWAVTQRYARLPSWLLQQYNPDIDFSDLRAGVELVVPKVEAVPAV